MSDLLITVLLVHLTLTDLIPQIVIVILLSIDSKMESLFVHYVTTNVMFVLELEMLVNLVKLLELIVVNLLQNHVHVQLCTMKIILKNVVLVIGDVMIVIPITKMDNYVTLVVISELETVVSVQLKDTSLMMLIKSKNVNLVMNCVELVMDMLQVTV